MEVFYISLILLPFLIFFLTLKFKNSNQKQKEKIKEAPGPFQLPIIGNLHLIAGSETPHQKFRNLSAIYGPIMRLKLGDIQTLIISSAESAKEILKIHDIDFASRPVNDSINAIFYGANNILFGSYGDFWRQMRRLCVSDLLCAKRVRSFRVLREEEVSNLVRIVGSFCGDFVDLSCKMAETSNNIVARATIGGRCDDQKMFLSALDDSVEFVSGFNFVDLFPSIAFIGHINGHRRRLMQCQKKLDLMAEKIVEEHKEKRSKHFTNNEGEQLIDEDLTDVLLRIQQEDSLQFSLTNNNIKAVINDMLMAGSETTSTTLEWVMSEIVRNPAVMEKVQNEVREVIGNNGGREKLVDEDLISGKLPYLQLVIKETLRLHPPATLLLPRENQESKVIMGYLIPPKTKVMINIWAIGRNESYWGDPENFRPERFEESSVDFKGAHFEYMPFGGGRRICPGINFAMCTMEVILAHLLYYFDWKFLGKEGEKIDMREAIGITTRRKFPLCLVPSLRFPISSI